jgi:hypothetical protein
LENESGQTVVHDCRQQSLFTEGGENATAYFINVGGKYSENPMIARKCGSYNDLVITRRKNYGRQPAEI